MDGAVERLGDAEVLANCAGFSVPMEFDAMEVAAYERLLRVNTLGSMYSTRALLPKMKENMRGRILFTSSMSGQVGVYGYTAYGASKFAIVGLAQALQMEVKAFGIAVSVSYPPDTDTPGFEVENVSKPEATRLISEGGGIFSAQKVASGIVKGIKNGDFTITCGLDGYLVSLGTAGFAPCFSVCDAICQVSNQLFCSSILCRYGMSQNKELFHKYTAHTHVVSYKHISKFTHVPAQVTIVI
ncbi:unnamed protein product [Choristocarpus tenellus]